ncbi:MAG: Zn-dependent protease with chaperone function [Chthonomonadaceae bacterium]|nr:Zn-dependent protease with chaperone function [Chthonomonadaceae bacterium]
MLRVPAILIIVMALWFCLCAIRVGAQRTAPPTPNVVAVPTTAVLPDPYTPHIPPRAIAYTHTQRALSLLDIAWNLLGLWLFVRSGGSARLRYRVYGLVHQPLPDENRPPPFRALLVFYGLYTLLLRLWNMPFGLAELATEWRYGFSHESLTMYLVDAAKDWGIGLLVAPLLCGLMWLILRSPRRWWLWMWGLTLPVLIGVLILQPIVIAPLFNTYSPLSDGPLRAKILALAARAGVPNADVFVEDSSRRSAHVNAYVTGVGPAARIVLNDTAIQTLPEDQLLAMIGHEMGHYVEKHIWYGLLSGTLGSGAFFFLAFRLWPVLETHTRHNKSGLRGPMDLATLPLLFFYFNVALLVQEPIANAEARYMEHRADAFGLRITGLNTATARLMVGFAERDFSDPDPPALLHFWFGTHPTLKERIHFALSGEVKPDIAPGAHP